MKKILSIILIFFVVLTISISLIFADVRVRGYFRSDGTYVQPHYRSNPDGNIWNNWSTYPNMNPYTGKQGTKYKDYYYEPKSNYHYTPSWNSNPTPLWDIDR